MSLTFKLNERLAGLLMNAPKQGEKAEVLYQDLVPPTDSACALHYLEQLQSCLLGFIEGSLRHPPLIISLSLSAVT